MESYQKKEEQLLEELKTTRRGLTSSQVIKKLEIEGYNKIPNKKKKNIFQMFLSEFENPILFVMLAACLFSFFIGEKIDGIAIIFIIVVDAIMGTVQEWKAEKSADSLEQMIKTKSCVVRDGKELYIDAEELVVGDIVLLESGNKISADLRILESTNLTIDESVLTGESISSNKNSNLILKSVGITDQTNMAFAGTSVMTGRAVCVVVKTGINTEIGKIASKVIETKKEDSPLTIRIKKFSKQVSMLVVIIAILLTILLLIRNEHPTEIFLSVIALSVSAMPEGLPLALTLALTIGSNRMAKRNVIVKKLNSVESLGSCTVIASDKTGTLTLNEQTAKKIILPDQSVFEIEGIGYNNQGKVVGEHLEKVQEISFLGAINNEAKLNQQNKKWIYSGDSIDIAFLALAQKQEIKIEDTILGKIPYESEKKYSAVFYKQKKESYCTVKGSLEVVLQFCDTMKVGEKIIPLNSSLIEEQNEQLASSGYRVIALAKGKIKESEKKDSYNEKDLSHMTFIGLVAFIDPIRKETVDSIKTCKKAGIQVLMITGDHPLTAFAISKELTLATNMDQVTTGEEIECYLTKDQLEFDQWIKTKTIFARVSPIQKLEIIESLKRQGEFVAVTGDGVNDSPAIQSAHIGIAMGSGTDVAKETSDMIITDDNFMSIVSAVQEGRNAYGNIRKVIYMLLSCGLAEVLFFFLSIFFHLPMPLIAVQLLWLNIVTDGLQDLALSFEREEDELMNDHPRNPKENIFDKRLCQEVLLSGLFIGISVFALWIYLIKGLHFDIKIARGYVMAFMVFAQNFHVLNCRSEKKSTFKISLFKNPFVLFSIASAILLQIMIMEIPVFSNLLQTSSIPLSHLILILCYSLPIVGIMELYKVIINKSHK